jgi:urease accessory protein
LNLPEHNSDLHWIAPLLQVSDPLFPTGAYAHSLGLEQWVQDRGLKTPDDLTRFLLTHAGPALARLELPYLRFARDILVEESEQKLGELEQEIDAWKWASELREASIAQGRGRLRLLRKLWKDPRIEFYQHALAKQLVHGHQLVVTALQFEILKVPMEAGLLTYGYQNLANYVSASIKLLRIGPEAAQVALHSSLEQLPNWVEQSLTIQREEAGWFAPAFDIACAQHATAFSRQFIS